MLISKKEEEIRGSKETVKIPETNLNEEDWKWKKGECNLNCNKCRRRTKCFPPPSR